jgi:hypothetical protein
MIQKRSKPSKRDRDQGRRVAAIEKALFSERRFSISTTSSTTSTTASLSMLTSLPVGDNDGNRSGTRICMHYIDLTFDCIVADSDNFVRMVLFIDRNDNTQGQSSGITGNLFADASYPWTSPLNNVFCYGKAARYRVLKDEVFCLATNWQACQRKSWRVNLQDTIAQYASSSTYPPDTNSLNVLVVSDSSAPSHPAYVLSTSLCYTP